MELPQWAAHHPPMRMFIVFGVLALPGCTNAFYDWQAMNHHRRMLPIEARAASPTGQAEALCEYRARSAVAGRDARWMIDMPGSAAAADLFNRCMDIYHRTGQVP